jgi:hypothetical protein
MAFISLSLYSMSIAGMFKEPQDVLCGTLHVCVGCYSVGGHQGHNFRDEKTAIGEIHENHTKKVHVNHRPEPRVLETVSIVVAQWIGDSDLQDEY